MYNYVFYSFRRKLVLFLEKNWRSRIYNLCLENKSQVKLCLWSWNYILLPILSIYVNIIYSLLIYLYVCVSIYVYSECVFLYTFSGQPTLKINFLWLFHYFNVIILFIFINVSETLNAKTQVFFFFLLLSPCIIFFISKFSSLCFSFLRIFLFSIPEVI